jgi:hypothetical protein
MRGGAVLDITLNAIEEAFAAKAAARQQKKANGMIDNESDAGSWAEALAFKDAVNPEHYKRGGIESIDYIQAKLSPEEFAGYCRGNMLKYLSRLGHKDEAAQEMRKAIWYGERWLQARNTRA